MFLYIENDLLAICILKPCILKREEMEHNVEAYL
jgi:hypothetical protein